MITTIFGKKILRGFMNYIHKILAEACSARFQCGSHGRSQNFLQSGHAYKKPPPPPTLRRQKAPTWETNIRKKAQHAEKRRRKKKKKKDTLNVVNFVSVPGEGVNAYPCPPPQTSIRTAT